MSAQQILTFAETRLVVIQATPFCNINCAYCYLPNRADKSRISHLTIKHIVRRLIEWRRLGRRVTILWHAGEPLILDARFYADAFTQLMQLEEYGWRVAHSIQTNATLISDSHCRVFQRFGANIGVSLDGSEEMHDEFRRTRSGTGTYNMAVAGVKKLQSSSIYPSAIAVLSKRSMQNPEAFYRAFADLKIPFVGLNVQEKEGGNKVTFFDDPEVTDSLYTSFLRSVFCLSLRDGRVLFRELVSLVDQIRRGDFKAQNSEAVPGHILSFSYDGKIATYSPELLTFPSKQYGAFGRGNVHTDRIEDVLSDLCAGPVGQSIRTGVSKCQSACAYFPVCGGGSPSNKLAELSRLDVTETAYCRYTKKLVLDVVLELLRDKELRALAVAQTYRVKQ